MGTKHLKSAFEAPVPPSERFLLVALADAHNDKTGQCNPSQDLLAKKTGFGLRTIVRLLQNLKNAGYISIERESRTDKNRYILHPVRSATATPRTKCHHDMSRSANLTCREVPMTTVRSANDDSSKCHGDTSTQYYTNPNKNPKEPELLASPVGDAEKKADSIEQKKAAKNTAEKSEKKSTKKPTAAESKQPRERDLLFDAIAEVCRLEPAVSGGVIGKCKKLLLKYDPPATPDEVRLFGRVYERQHPVNVIPTWGILANQFKLVRDNAAVERIMNSKSRLAAGAQAYRDRIEQYDPSTTRPLTAEEKSQLEQEDISF